MAGPDREKSQILLVDDELPNRGMMKRITRQMGYHCFEAANGKAALKILAQHPIDLVVTDIAMPEMDGLELTRHIKAGYPADVIMMTAFTKDLTYEAAIAAGASDFIQKPFTREEFQIRVQRVLRERKIQRELKAGILQLQQILDGVIDSLSATVEARDPYTSGHQKRVARIATRIAREMGLSEAQVRTIEMASVIHDLGKIAVPAEILSKPSRLSETEYSLLKVHPQVAYTILKDIPFSDPISEIIFQHHERLDGTGYPRGLKKDEILMEARVIAVADTVEAMSSHRPYRPALGTDAAMAEISAHRGTRYDPDVVDACLTVMAEADLLNS